MMVSMLPQGWWVFGHFFVGFPSKTAITFKCRMHGKSQFHYDIGKKRLDSIITTMAYSCVFCNNHMFFWCNSSWCIITSWIVIVTHESNVILAFKARKTSDLTVLFLRFSDHVWIFFIDLVTGPSHPSWAPSRRHASSLDRWSLEKDFLKQRNGDAFCSISDQFLESICFWRCISTSSLSQIN